MSSLTITIKPKINNTRKVLVEMDAEKLERFAADFGFFSQEFLKSLERAEKDYKKGRVQKIKNLKQLR